MKKNAFIILLIAMFFLSACSVNMPSDVASFQSNIAEQPTSPSTEIVRYQLYPILFPSLQKLVETSEIIIVGKVSSSSINRIDLQTEGNVSGEIEMFTNVSSFYIDVSQVIKGKVPSDMKLKVDLLCGGEVNGYVEIYEPEIPSPNVGEQYVFFINAQEKNKDREFFKYKFEGSFDGFVKIENCKVIPPQNSDSVFEETTYDSLIIEIESMVD